MANLLERAYNPDILNCLANLSNDEVFTPPELANRMLDLLPAEIWQSRDVKILDPCCKTGVFLREAAKRLIEAQMPGYQERTDAIEKMRAAGVSLAAEDEAYLEELQQVLEHVFKHQLYGIAISELTSLMTRRSLYCSKYPESKYSIVRFDDPKGNIDFKLMNHTWVRSKCVYCGANEEFYKRSVDMESYAYEFIHLDDPNEVFNMQFDVIVGNPPYQLGSNDNRKNSRDRPIYNLFVEQAKKLNPRYLSMIIPSRWMTSGLGLTEFRRTMLQDKRILTLVDYPVASEVFPGVEIKGGVCYFLWDRAGDSNGRCEVTTVRNNKVSGPVSRNLDEYDVFVRDSRSLPILHKVLAREEESVKSILSVDKEFGWTSNFDDFCKHEVQDAVPIYYGRQGKRLTGWIERANIYKSTELIDTWKVMVPQAGSDGGQRIPDPVIGTSFIAPSPSVCTQTFLFFYVGNKSEAKSVQSYISTKFVRFLISLRKITQHATRSTYLWVPMQKWDHLWTDQELYAKYGLTEEEIEHIEYLIKPMDLSD